MNGQDQLNFPSSTQKRIARKFRIIARTLSLILALVLVIFSALSGSGEAGGIIENLPNAFPWIALLAFVFIAWKWEMVGGFLLIIMGVFSIFFFDAASKNSWPVLFIISLPLLIFGGLFIASSGLSNDK